ncbi:outer membrane lipoprotein carrier protein LolA [Aliidiomarina sedimenti]|uniref:Outer-membrane lipoprotein carrier protein n=1 Tax=Aliidiomarina sedimenti TaxID=1933879 RepID=A0ABY0C101_9GAMM|nr:outer membrane lipoprotein chaperone LolA [Aliidiomarina sedimenti]RUO31542.1 outer membrane lipoprotein carrier protein LolA [Aliidiomarina sedimenti]
MKIATYGVASVLLAMSTLAFVSNAAEVDDLRSKLDQIDTLHASFEQQVFDERGELQEELEGDLILKRPHFLRWETTFPDESIMVADGEAVWYLNAFVEQLSIFDQAQNLEQNPMLVLLSDDDAAWNEFTIERDGEFWVIREEETGYSQVSLAIAFDADDAIQTMRIDDGQGQISVFALSNTELNRGADAHEFEIDVPEGVEIDDQRGQSF